MDTNIKPSPPIQAIDDALKILQEGAAEVRGLFRLGSNETYLCEIHSALGSLHAVYKPVCGERPLWDFPAEPLGKREAAAFEMARLLGWNFVPPTVFRLDGPLGAGSFQQYMDLDLEQNYFELRDRDPDSLRRVAAFDVLINNADRKAMHVACDRTGAIWLIDHGVCFHREWKLRTVIWDFAGEVIPDEILKDLASLFEFEREDRSHPSPAADSKIRSALAPYLSLREVHALESRAIALWEERLFPRPGPGISVPWPLLA